MNQENLDHWEEEFRAAAVADDFSIFRDHLRRIELPDTPDLMLEGTILIVRTCFSYCVLDQRSSSFDRFLAMQTYDPAKAIDARYSYTFDIFGRAFGRVLGDIDEAVLDLADLYGTPWQDFKLVGYRHLWVSHPDWRGLSKEDVTEIENSVTNDIRYDFPEEEVDLYCDDSTDKSYVLVTVQDVYDHD